MTAKVYDKAGNYMTRNIFAGMVRAVLLMAVMLTVSACIREQRIEQQTVNTVTATTVLATLPEISSSSAGAAASTGGTVPSEIAPISAITFNRKGHGVAYVESLAVGMRVVHNGKPGKSYQQVANPVISPNGKRLAYRASESDKWFIVAEGRENRHFDEVGDPVFSPDSKHFTYTAKSGGNWQIVVDNAISRSELSFDGFPFFSGDSGKIAYIVSATQTDKMRLVISTLDFAREWVFDASGSGLTLNAAFTRMAVVKETAGKQYALDIDFLSPDQIKTGPPYDSIGFLAYGPDNVTLAYYAENAGRRLLVMNGREESIPEAALVAQPQIDPAGRQAFGVLAGTDVYLKKFFAPGTIKDRHYDGIYDFTFNHDGSRYAYSAHRGEKWFVVVNGLEGPTYDKVVVPQFSRDGKYLVYRARKEGRRFVVVADAGGNVLRQLPNFEMVFQPIITEGGSSLAYGVKDGAKLIWQVEKL